MIFNKAYTRITGRKDGSVRQPCHDTCTVAEASVIGIVCPFITVWRILHKSRTVCANPKVIIIIHIHTADTLTVQLSGQFILDPSVACPVDNIESLIGSDVITVLPCYYGIDDPALHTDGAIHILERGFGQAQKSES